MSKRPASERPVFVYLIQAGPGGPIKIGYAYNVERRLSEFQTGCPEKLTVVGSIKCHSAKFARGYEQRLHAVFSHARIGKSEWFRLSADVYQLIESTKTICSHCGHVAYNKEHYDAVGHCGFSDCERKERKRQWQLIVEEVLESMRIDDEVASLHEQEAA